MKKWFCFVSTFLFATTFHSFSYAQVTDVSSVFAQGGHVRITYDGQMQGRFTANDGRAIPVSGAYRVNVTYNGNSVSGSDSLTLNSPQSGGGTTTFQGTRTGNICDITDNNGLRLRAVCTFDSFEYNQTNTDSSGSLAMTLNTRRTNAVDVLEQQRQEEIARIETERQRAAYQAQLIQQQQEAEAFIRSRPRATRAQSTLLAQAINQDSQFWFMNRLDQGELYDVVTLPSPSNDVTIVRGSYTYNGGSQGWASARIRGSTVECIEYWDFQGTCAPIRYAAPSDQSGSSYSDRRREQREHDLRELEGEIQARQAQTAGQRPQ
ncbi:hypothetical protein [Brevundimonas sp.]|jgi:hypothetical protein|uniref:hypothetical protein n=1 Tax=Brevundimonas sp. TaxID=1871086 RepID=UPI00260A5D7C|nr:hypothetical protein [Brevundimonas sp.]